MISLMLVDYELSLMVM